MKKWGKQVCMTNQFQGGQDGIQKPWHKHIEVGRDYVEMLLRSVVNKG
jgi:hypothetical protein